MADLHQATLEAFGPLGGPQARTALLAALPPSSMLSAARPLLGSDNPSTALIALISVASGLAFGAACEPAAQVLLACYQLGRAALAKQGAGGPLLSSTVSMCAANHVTACVRLGRFDAVLDFVAREISYLETLEPDENVSTVRVARMTALLANDQVDQAAELLEREGPGIRGAATIERDRIARAIADVLSGDG
jgi:hypothetical protein